MKPNISKFVVAFTAFVIGVVKTSVWLIDRTAIVVQPSAPQATLQIVPAQAQSDARRTPLTPANFQLLYPGEFHGDEIMAQTGEQWLGLYPNAGGGMLREVSLEVFPVHDPVLDEDEQARTGKGVSVRGLVEPTLLVRIDNPAALQPGQIVTAWSEATPLTNRTNLPIQLGGVTYHLRVETSDTSETAGIARDDAKLVLVRGTERQVLYELGGTGQEAEAWWNLLWVGDMDGDGRLDLYVQVADHYNVAQRELYLSSQAAEGQLVRKVAEFRITGC